MSHVKFGPSLSLWMAAVGVLCGIALWAPGTGRGATFFVRYGGYGDYWPVWSTYFYGGVFAGANGWMKFFEYRWSNQDGENDEDEQARANKIISIAHRTWWIWYIPITVIYYASPLPASSLPVQVLQSCSFVMMAFGLIIALIDDACRKFKTVNVMMMCMMQAAFPVYLLHPIVVASVTMAWSYILHYGFGVDIEFDSVDGWLMPPASATVMSPGLQWLGFFFINILSQVIAWPFAFLVKKIPYVKEII